MHSNGDLENYYADNSSLMLNYKYSLEDLDNMIPWERTIYIHFVNEHVKKKQELIKQTQQQLTL